MKEMIKYTIIGLFIFICSMASIVYMKNKDLTTSLINVTDINTFSVELSNNGEKISNERIIPSTNPKSITATSATINNTIISGINVTFSGTNEKAIYKVYSHNKSNINAYLKGIISGRLYCTPGENTSLEVVNKLCSNVVLSIKTNKEELLSTNNIDGTITNINKHILGPNKSEEIIITIDSTSDINEKAQFTVIVPTISLMYYSND